MNKRFTSHLLPLTLILAVVMLLMVSCHKTCRCYRYDGVEYEYTADEVDDQMGGNCSSMIYQGDSRYYSMCEWE